MGKRRGARRYSPEHCHNNLDSHSHRLRRRSDLHPGLPPVLVSHAKRHADGALSPVYYGWHLAVALRGRGRHRADCVPWVHVHVQLAHGSVLQPREAAYGVAEAGGSRITTGSDAREALSRALLSGQPCPHLHRPELAVLGRDDHYERHLLAPLHVAVLREVRGGDPVGDAPVHSALPDVFALALAAMRPDVEVVFQLRPPPGLSETECSQRG
mmetsp:Transcript_13323/g.31791  ORF Transcript_13323/g.31791 Transcript_13323/m.31791 type:complete len:213 (-) Transcript_13323:277-915(-)